MRCAMASRCSSLNMIPISSADITLSHIIEDGELAAPQGEGGAYSLLRIVEERGGELLVLEKTILLISDHLPEDARKSSGSIEPPSGDSSSSTRNKQCPVDAAIAHRIGVLEKDIVDARPYPKGWAGAMPIAFAILSAS